MKKWVFNLIFLVFFPGCPGCDNHDSLHRVCPSRCVVADESDYTERTLEDLKSKMGVGQCKWGTPVCDDDMRIVDCVGAVHPSAEVCDGIDNDCNGGVDTYLAPHDFPCLTMGACRTARAICKDGGFQCMYDDDVELPEETRCDGIDNDCDGRIDEDVFRGEFCYEGPIGSEYYQPCHPGSLRCIDGQAVCYNQELPSAEVCDQIDNDCDGVIDNGGDFLTEKYDMVFVMDTSGSMCGTITAVATALNAYAEQFDGNENFRFALVVISSPTEPLVQVINDFTDFSTIRTRLSSMSCNGSGREANIDAAHDLCHPDNPLELSWRSDANRMFFMFTDEYAQSYVDPLHSVQGIIDSCIETSTLAFIWSHYWFNNGASFSDTLKNIAEGSNGVFFEISSDWELIFDELNSIVIQLCGE